MNILQSIIRLGLLASIVVVTGCTQIQLSSGMYRSDLIVVGKVSFIGEVQGPFQDGFGVAIWYKHAVEPRDRIGKKINFLCLGAEPSGCCSAHPSVDDGKATYLVVLYKEKFQYIANSCVRITYPSGLTDLPESLGDSKGI